MPAFLSEGLFVWATDPFCSEVDVSTTVFLPLVDGIEKCILGRLYVMPYVNLFYRALKNLESNAVLLRRKLRSKHFTI